MLWAKRPIATLNSCYFLDVCKEKILASAKLYSTYTSGEKRCSKTNKFLIYCNTQLTKHGRNGEIKEAESLFHRMPDKTVVTYTAMLSAYANNGHIESARKLFDEMPHKNIPSWNAMITAYVRAGELEDAYKLFLMMPLRNAMSYSTMITGFVRARRFGEAQSLYELIPVKLRDPLCSNILLNGYLKIGRLEEAVRIFEDMLEKDVVSWSSMVDGYCKSGRFDDARKLFDSMGNSKNEFTWCSMIDGYMKAGRFEDGFDLLTRMRRENGACAGLGPNLMTVIFEACGRTARCKEGCQVHGLVSRLGFELDVFLGNSIVTMYSRFGCVDDARKMFDSMSQKDVVSWNSMIYGYVQSGRLEEACEIFKKAESKDSISWTTLLTGFSNQGSMDKCVDIFNDMPERDDISWTVLISGFSYNEQHKNAFSWFVNMIRGEIRPSSLTMSSLISASAGLASLSHGQQMHALVLKMGLEHDLSIQNSLVSMYSKCGTVNDAYTTFKSISSPNTVSFNSMITGLAHNGYAKEALELFKRLTEEGQEPNEVTFLGVLSACAHSGLVEEGYQYLSSMKTCYNIEPGPDHYSCMVHLLGKAGLVDEAYGLIKSMPVKPHGGVWGALLDASRAQMRVDLAEIAARYVQELEPGNATPYVVLSEMYSLMRKTKDEERMMLGKRLSGIKKSPGFSWSW